MAQKKDFVIPLLARRSFHLPGNNLWQDWCQWFGNNHIVFGICLHHRLHPVTWWERILALVASISFGFVATSIVYEMYQTNWATMETKVINLGGQLAITKGMLILWTFGGLCHTIFDLAVWKIMACACCQPGGLFGHRLCFCNVWFQNCGSYCLLPVIFILLSLAIYYALRRASQDEQPQQQQGNNGNGDFEQQDDDDVYEDWQDTPYFFVVRYCIELLLAWLVYFPTVGTVLFSGVLGCHGRLPVLGGRPRDVRLVEEEAREYRQFV
jgi:hypothetical protein